MKVVLASGGAFRLSRSALARYSELAQVIIKVLEPPGPGFYESYHRVLFSGEEVPFFVHEIPRNDATLVQVVEELGTSAAADPDDLELSVVEIPDDVIWKIVDIAGFEYIRYSKDD